MRKLLSTVGVMAVLLTSLSARGKEEQAKDAPEETKKASIWMKQKLAATQNILAGLTKADFPAISGSANTMLAVSYLEKYVRSDRPGYQTLMSEFEQANKMLVVAARDKNLDGATVAYLQLTISCVNCHKIVRDAPK
jgi:hypothetical protein